MKVLICFFLLLLSACNGIKKLDTTCSENMKCHLKAPNEELITFEISPKELTPKSLWSLTVAGPIDQVRLQAIPLNMNLPQLEMGPKNLENGPLTFQGDFPVCTMKTMKWRFKLKFFIKDQEYFTFVDREVR